MKVEQISPVQQNLIKDSKTLKQTAEDTKKEIEAKTNKLSGDVNLYKEADNKKEVSLIEEFADKIAAKKKEDKIDEKLKQEIIEKLKEKINKLISQWNIQLDFSIDKDLDKVIVKVKDRDTGKVIRQIPPEEMLRIAKSLEELSGLLLDLWG